MILWNFYRLYRINHGHVTRSQLRQVLTTAVILLSREEIYALEQRYNDDLGFNYSWFLEELEARTIERPLYHNMLQEMRKINAPRASPQPTEDETNIVVILAKLKAKVVRERINVKYIYIYTFKNILRRLLIFFFPTGVTIHEAI